MMTPQIKPCRACKKNTLHKHYRNGATGRFWKCVDCIKKAANRVLAKEKEAKKKEKDKPKDREYPTYDELHERYKQRLPIIPGIRPRFME
ncbi:MAG: hypothetical protein KGJ09_09685 [Candidatus Omnitrophica bacterium]|nr:hypothetical protein [Candidatus Omnitrophota bacterium]MDE2215379.1 hypothetical protein [Candidatus Omnitrophota bacterium]